MVSCPNCGREAMHTRTFYVDPTDDIIEVFCDHCGITTSRTPPAWNPPRVERRSLVEAVSTRRAIDKLLAV